MADEDNTPWWGGMWYDTPGWLLQPLPLDGAINKEIPTSEVSLFWDTNLIICDITTQIPHTYMCLGRKKATCGGWISGALYMLYCVFTAWKSACFVLFNRVSLCSSCFGLQPFCFSFRSWHKLLQTCQKRFFQLDTRKNLKRKGWLFEWYCWEIDWNRLGFDEPSSPRQSVKNWFLTGNRATDGNRRQPGESCHVARLTCTTCDQNSKKVRYLLFSPNLDLVVYWSWTYFVGLDVEFHRISRNLWILEVYWQKHGCKVEECGRCQKLLAVWRLGLIMFSECSDMFSWYIRVCLDSLTLCCFAVQNLRVTGQKVGCQGGNFPGGKIADEFCSMIHDSGSRKAQNRDMCNAERFTRR